MMLMPVQLVVRLWACMRVRLIEEEAFSHACFCRYGSALIHWAAEKGHSSAVKLLIANEAEVNARDR